MYRISFYHWLPIADNMLPEIEDALRKKGDGIVGVHSQDDAVYYEAQFKFAPNERMAGFFPVKGKINQRGFTQNVLMVPPIPGLSLSALTNEVVVELRDFLVELLFCIAPLAVRNKLAVLNEGIVSLQEFESKVFDPLIDAPAKSFLRDYHFVAILVDKSLRSEMDTPFKVPRLKLNVSPTLDATRAIVNEDENCILFYSECFSEEEQETLDSVIYKFCALATFVRFVSRVIVILKQARDNVIPLRRQLAIALQRDTEEYFGLLTRMKKYLTYVNIKLPVVQKVLNHLAAAKTSNQFQAKVASFDEPQKILKYPTICAIDRQCHPRLQPSYIIEKINEDTARLKALYTEDIDEMKVISEELSEVLEGSLMSESVEISARGLDASQASLDLDRGSKNRANALVIFSLLVVANVGYSLAGEFKLDTEWKVLAMFVLVAGAFLITRNQINSKSSCFRLIIPFNEAVPADCLKKMAEREDLKRSESNGGRRTITWSEQLRARIKPHPGWPLGLLVRFRRAHNQAAIHNFDLTIDYEARGFIHSVTVETEHDHGKFDMRELVIQVIQHLAQGDGLSQYDHKDTSLLAKVLSNLDIPLVPALPSLNRLLAEPADELGRVLSRYLDGPEDTSISKEDRIFAQDILGNKMLYKRWLVDLVTEKPPLLTLLGESNVERKESTLSTLERSNGG